jgi:hypothetical protein
LAAASVLGGCGSVLTEGTATGAGMGALADAGLKYAERRVHGAEQNEIAAVAGPLDVGVVAAWHVEHDVPIEDDEHGELVVARTLGSEAFACKEVVFSVDTIEDKKAARAFYTATICRDGPVWKWATAEPATARWGGLQ